jgi:hypothetical protein
MLWYYARGRDVFQVEASFEKATEEFVLRFHVGHHKDQVERFTDEIAFRNRLDALEQDLATQQWERVVGPPMLLKDGWKL